MYKYLEQFFKDTCILSVRCIHSNPVSLAEHVIGRPVRQILGITFASGSLLRSYKTIAPTLRMPSSFLEERPPKPSRDQQCIKLPPCVTFLALYQRFSNSGLDIITREGHHHIFLLQLARIILIIRESSWRPLYNLDYTSLISVEIYGDYNMVDFNATCFFFNKEIKGNKY